VQVPGTGLMADPSNVANQFQFAQGLMALPGGQKALQSFAPMLSQAIQSKQFDRTDARMGDQFNRTFDQTQQHQDQQQSNWADQQARLQEQWKAQFDQSAAQAAFQRQMESARLAQSERFHMDTENRADKRAAAGAGGDKIPTGYGVVDTASGKSLAPMPGTENFAKAKEAEGATVDTINTINSYMDDYLGKEVKTPDGNIKRMGGMGSEQWGPGRAQMEAKRGSIIAQMGAMRDMGVLQKEEYERLANALPTPDKIFTSDKSVQAAYSGLRDEFGRKLERQRKANPWLVPPPPPGYK
jgi:hypothetical protein